MNRYESYKDSGVEWIKSIPLNWELKKIKYIFWERKENNNPIKSNNLISLTIEKGVIPHSEKTGGGNKPKDDLTKYKLVYPGDIVLNSMNVIAGAVGISEYFGVVSPVYYMLIPIDNKFTTEYFHHLFRTELFQKSLYGLGNGILIKENEETGKLNTIRMRIPMDKLGIQLIPVPSIQEQKLIARYLDKKTAQIDLLIEKIEKKITLLKEKRTALINQCVTKGLDPNVEMQDSGIEWIGRIPKHWDRDRIGRTTYVKGRIGWKGLRSEDFLEEGPYLVTGTDFKFGLINWSTCYRVDQDRYEEDPFIILKEDDIVITKDGTIGKVAHITKLPSPATLNSGIFVTRPSKRQYTQRFFFWIISSSLFKDFVNYNSSGSTILHLYQNVFEKFYFPLPLLQEQKLIAQHLDKQTTKIDLLIEKLKNKIVLIQEKRQALISSVVTGKVRVTEAML